MKHKKTKNSDKESFACAGYSPDSRACMQVGLTKREYFAAKALQGLLSNDEHIKDDQSWPETTSQIALKYADALLNALDNKA